MLLLNDRGEYELSPAFDMLPSGQALGYQQMRVGAQQADATLVNTLSECRLFGLKPTQAMAEVRAVAAVVDGWQAHFASVGVRPTDILALSLQIDRPFLLEQRQNLA